MRPATPTHTGSYRVRSNQGSHTERPAVQRIAFYQLPLWVRLAAALTLFNTWVLIAEFVIDRYGLDEYLPFYRYGDICLWDIAVIIGIAALFVRASRIPRDNARLEGNPTAPAR